MATSRAGICNSCAATPTVGLNACGEIASEFAALNLDIVVATCTPTTNVMRKASQTIPLVMAGASDPVGQGLIGRYRRPGVMLRKINGAGIVIAG